MLKKFLNIFVFKTIPLFISVLFHPLFMPLLGIYILLHSDNPSSFLTEDSKSIILTIVALSTIGLPIFLIILTNFKKIGNINFLTEREDRTLPLIITAIVYYLNFYLLRKMEAPILIQVFCLGTIIAIVFTLIINLFWKISTHMVGIGGIAATIMVLILFYRSNVLLYLLFTILSSGTIGYARLSLNAHTPAQIYTGFFSGFSTIFISYLFLV